MKVAGAFLLLSFGALAAGCGSGVYGSAVSPAAGPAAPAPSSSRTLAWIPVSTEKLTLTSTRKDGAGTIRLRPTKATDDLGALVVFPGSPDRGARYRFEVRVRGSRNLPRLVIGLDANGAGVVPPLTETVSRRWRRYSIEAPAKTAATLEGKVYVPNWAWVTTPHSWIEISGRIRQPITAVSP